MNDRWLKHLRDEIGRQNAVLVLGSGVSIEVTDHAPAAFWTGLLEDGARRCADVAQPLYKGWLDDKLKMLQNDDKDDRLAVAEIISSKLRAPKGGEFGLSLSESVGSLKVKNQGLIEAVGNLSVPIATTNYDNLIEEATGLQAVNWRQHSDVQKVLRGAERRVLHLHGDYKQPESVVLGIRSYDRVLGDKHQQRMLRALIALRTFIFVGCGDGLSDPNFGALLEWSRVFVDSQYPH